MSLRASIAKQYGAEDPADSIATNPIPQMDWLKERCSMFWAQPQTLTTIGSENPKMRAEGYFRPVQYPGVIPGKGISTTYGFNLVINAQVSKEKQEVLHELYKFIFSDPIDCWAATAPFTLARKSGWRDNPLVRQFPNVDEIITATDRGVFLPRTLVFKIQIKETRPGRVTGEGGPKEQKTPNEEIGKGSGDRSDRKFGRKP